MQSTLLFLAIAIVVLAFVYFKLKKASRAKPRIKDGNRQIFKDFERDRQIRGSLENDPEGALGEAAVMQLVADTCRRDGRKFVVMKNLYIPSRGGTTEIDSLLLHQTGIYVFESKNISGEISGNAEDERWNQRINARITHTFHNPIMQNAGHMRALFHYLRVTSGIKNLEESDLFSMIVFSDRCALKDIPISGENWTILHIFRLQKKLAQLFQTHRNAFSERELEAIYNKLAPCLNASESVKAEHLKYIKSAYKKG